MNDGVSVLKRRKLLLLQIRNLIPDYPVSMRDKEGTVESYISEERTLEFAEMVKYRTYLNSSIKNFYNSIEGVEEEYRAIIKFQ